MGGWIGLHLALKHKEKVAGFVGLASAVDFLERAYKNLPSEALKALESSGMLPGYPYAEPLIRF